MACGDPGGNGHLVAVVDDFPGRLAAPYAADLAAAVLAHPLVRSPRRSSSQSRLPESSGLQFPWPRTMAYRAPRRRLMAAVKDHVECRHPPSDRPGAEGRPWLGSSTGSWPAPFLPARSCRNWPLGGAFDCSSASRPNSGRSSSSAAPARRSRPYVRRAQSSRAGPYRYSRNPIYVGMFVFVGGAGIALDSLWQFAALAALLCHDPLGVVAREEAYLTRKFGPVVSGLREAGQAVDLRPPTQMAGAPSI